jgi:hypothetical protein
LIFGLRVFELLFGGKASKVARRQIQTECDAQNETGADPEFIRQDTYDQWRNFEMLEYYLMHPRTLRTQTLFQLDEALQGELLKRYYSLDDDFVRELLGRRLRRRMRKELSEIAAHVKIKSKSAVRQFDNLLRVKKRLQNFPHRSATAVSSSSERALSDFVQRHFLIGRELASKYARIVFLLCHRLDVKRRLARLSYAEIDALANILMCKWIGTANGEVACSSSDVVALSLDAKFLAALRDLKTLLSDRTYLSLYKKSIKPALNRTAAFESSNKSASRLRLTPLLKTLLTLGAGLGQPKEFKDFFVDLVDKVGVPLKQLNLSRTDIQTLCDVLTQGFVAFLDTHAHSFEVQGPTSQYLVAWTRFLQAIRDCLVILYDHI